MWKYFGIGFCMKMLLKKNNWDVMSLLDFALSLFKKIYIFEKTEVAPHKMLMTVMIISR